MAWQQQRTLYSLMTCYAWETLKTFTQNDPQLKGNAGAIMVLHTHSRRLDYHPHLHCVVPAAAIDTEQRLWRTKTSEGSEAKNSNKTGYLFNHKALAKLFRAKLLDAIRAEGLALPDATPKSGSWTSSLSAAATKRWFI